MFCGCCVHVCLCMFVFECRIMFILLLFISKILHYAWMLVNKGLSLHRV